MDAINLQKFRLEPPRRGDEASIEEWMHSVSNAQAQLENQHIRIINLELMLRFCRNSWVMHNYQLEWCKEIFNKHLESLNSSVELINKQRKMKQAGYARSLQVLAHKYPTPFDSKPQ